MAKATMRYKEEAVMVIKEVPVSVILELSINETKFLSAVLDKVGGNPTTTVRQYQNNISDQLNKFELGYDFLDKITGTLICKE